MSTRLGDYNYHLPRGYIAQRPAEKRDEAKLLILHRNSGDIEHRIFHEITEFLSPGDILVLNNTKVIPSLLTGNRGTGAFLELLLIEEVGVNTWKAFIKTNARLRTGERIYIGNDVTTATILAKSEGNTWVIEFNGSGNIKDFLCMAGKMPLPPYIKRNKVGDDLSLLDRERYQTVFARKEGSIAAPTAGLHFSENTLDKIKENGIDLLYVTLHVGIGTFLPIQTEDIRKHHMHKEYYECSQSVFHKIQEAKKLNKKIIATGSTTCRVLETIALKKETPPVLSGWTDLFIYPPYQFSYVNALITNFHLPESTLLLLVSAFAGRENILNAYEVAKKNGYRFFSYGDCMLIV